MFSGESERERRRNGDCSGGDGGSLCDPHLMDLQREETTVLL